MRPLLALAVLLTLSACTIPRPNLQLGAVQTENDSSATVGVRNSGVAASALNDLNREDRRRALTAEFRALEFEPVGANVDWQGRGASGSVTALAPFKVGSQNCRQLTHSLTIDGEPVVAKGSACRETDGSWTPLS